MNLSDNSKQSLFVPFLPHFSASSWSTLSSMSCEEALKSDKKSDKNQLFRVAG